MIKKIVPERRNSRTVTPTTWTRVSDLTGLPVATSAGIEVALAYTAEIATSIDTKGWQWLEEEYYRLWLSRESTIHGSRKYALIEQALERLSPWRIPDPAACAPGLELVRRAQKAEPSSVFLSALLGYLLTCHAFAWARSNYPSDIKDASVRAVNDEAAQLFADCPKGHDNDPFWLRILCRSALIDQSSPAEKEKRYKAAAVLDPGDAYIHLARANQLLPGWYGSYEMFEEFAIEAAELSSASSGRAMYAQVYNLLSMSHDLKRSNCDWARLRSAFEDSMQVLPSQLDANMFARTAWAYRDKDALHTAFEQHLSTYFPFLWKDDRQFLSAFKASGCEIRRTH